LALRGHHFASQVELDTVREIKEKMCYSVSNYDESLKESEESHACEKSYDLPDGKKVVIGNERFKCPEALFSPIMAGHEMDGLHKYCYDSILKCEVEVRKDLL
jgi:actin